MMNFTDLLYKLVEGCSSGSIRTRIDLVSRPDMITAGAHVSTLSHGSFFHSVIRGSGIWDVFANTLKNLSGLILKNCTAVNSISAKADATVLADATALNLMMNDKDNGISVSSLAIGFVSGVVAASLVVTSYFLLRKCLTRVGSREVGEGYITTYNDDESEEYLQPSSTLDDSKEVGIENVLPYI